MPARDEAGAASSRRSARPHVPGHDFVAALGLLLFALYFFRGAVLGRGVLFQRDISLVWYPQIESFVRCVGSGSLPLWDPYRGFGQPLLADPSAEVLYPFTWLNLVAPPWISYTVFVVVHLWLSGLGLYALARHWSVTRLGALTGGVLWMGGGPFLSLGSVWHHMAGAAWIPWVFLSAEIALERPRLATAAAWGAVMAGQILAGSADMVAMTWVAVAIVASARILGGPESPLPRAIRIAATAAFAGLVGLGLSACQWIPTVAMAMGTARLGLDSSERTIWSLHPLALLELALPFHWSLVPLSTRRVVSLLGSREPWLPSIYFGGPALGLAVAGSGFGTLGRRIALGSITLGAVAVALGRHLWAYDVLITVLPPLRILRFPMKAMVLCGFTVSLLAALGLDGCLERRRVLMATLAGLLALAAGGLLSTTWATGWWAPSFLARGPGLPSDVELLAITASRLRIGLLVTAVAAAATLLLFRGLLSRSAAAAALALCVIVDLATAHGNLHPIAPKAIFTHRPEVVGALIPSENSRVYVYDYSMLPRFRRGESGGPSPLSLPAVPPGWSPLQALTLGAIDYLTPPTPERWGMRGSYDLDLLGLQPRRMAEMNEFLRKREGDPVHTRLLRMGSVSSLVDLAPPSRWPDLELTGTLPSLFSEPIRVYRVPEPLPWTYVVGSGIVADGEEALERIASADFDPGEQVLLPSGPVLPHGPPFAGKSRVVSSAPDRIAVTAELSRAGYLVLVEAYDPGWKVSVDGNEGQLLRANVAFRGVELAQGTHSVDFVYRPPSVTAGFLATGGTLLLTLAALRAKESGTA